MLISMILFDLIIIVYSLIRFPASRWLNASPVVVLLILFGMAVRKVWIYLMPSLPFWGLKLGVISGLFLGREVLLEYLLLPKDNTAYGLVEYCLFRYTLYPWCTTAKPPVGAFCSLNRPVLRCGGSVWIRIVEWLSSTFSRNAVLILPLSPAFFNLCRCPFPFFRPAQTTIPFAFWPQYGWFPRSLFFFLLFQQSAKPVFP